MRHLKEKHCHIKNRDLNLQTFSVSVEHVVKETKVSESTVSIKTEHYELHKGRLTA